MTGGEYPTLSGEGAARLSASAARIVVVGAGGWLGLATLEALHGLLGAAFSERVACFGSSGRTLALRGGLTVPQQPLGRIGDLPSAPTLVLHLAFLTQEKAKAMSDADYIAANGMISSRVLAALDAMGAQAVFVPSSGAAYLVEDRDAAASMRLYGRLKLKDEVRFRRWADSRGRRATIARVFNLSGPYINKRSSYALACFIADALADRPIVIKARRPVLRSYAAVRELMSVVFGLLTGVAEAPAPFDTAGDRDYEMAEIAAVVQEVVGHRRGIERPPLEAGKP
ncbi:MAG: NAD(P)-dependent oxidoreductase, partial [Caulobacteraceae bacterium]